ncbi:M10 family metallopeptidase C-terminal domain-containing protein [Altererythrobacter aquiaggeris]|uniref:M10 family metallopeptidase C-terminal domain-containing protein n=1 Tax=Aestuarierythrobacter aquiaggeris TaxID=1898396 RepID=UPI003019BE53
MSRKIDALLEDDGQFEDHAKRPGEPAANNKALAVEVDAVSEPLGFNLDDFAGLGFTYRGKEIADLDRVEQQIDSGRAHSISGNNTITFTFLKEGQDLISIYNNPNYGFSAGNGVAAFTEAQKAYARESIGLWDDLIAPEFREQNGRGADIQFANSRDPAQAYAYYPNEKGGYKYLGDVFVADAKSEYDGTFFVTPTGGIGYDGDIEGLIYEGNFTNADLSFGGYGATTITHELGHAIGLSHPGAYNFGPGFSVNYANGAEYAQDSEQYSIMSYWDASETGARIVDWGTFFFSNPQTPLLHDIYVAQQKYGADPTTRTGDTTYGFNSNAGREVFDFTSNEHPYLSIYDAGGIDTLDFSGFEASVVINLNAGGFSSAGQGNITSEDTAIGREARNDAIEYTYGIENFYSPVAQGTIDAVMGSYMTGNAARNNADWGHTGARTTQYDNISIAYGTTIENAIGTDYRDLIIANEVDNTLTGNGGDDVFIFLHGGDDTITDFESGSDMIDLSAFGITDADVSISEGLLEADFNADGVADLSITFTNGAELAATDVFYG